MAKIKPTISVGSEGIGVGIQVDWSSNDQHRHRKVPGSKNWERRHRFEDKPVIVETKPEPTGARTPPWWTSRARAPRIDESLYLDPPSPTVESEMPPVETGDYPYEVYYPPEKDPPRPEEDRVFRGPLRVPGPGKTMAGRTIGWQVVLRVLWEIMHEVWERDKATKHRWDPSSPQVIQRERDMPWIYDPAWKPKAPRERRVWIPPEWEPPPKVIDKVTKEIGVEMGRIVIGPLVLEEPDSILVWDPQPWPGPVRAPGAEVRTTVERRGTSKQPVIVMTPTARPSPYRRYKWKVNPAHEWFPETPPVSAPRPIPQMPPPAPQWVNGILVGAAAVALAALPEWDVLPDLHLSTVAGNGTPPRVEVAVASGRFNRPRMRDPREHRLNKETKTEGQLKYLQILRFINKTWGKLTEVGDFGKVVLRSTHGVDGSRPFGYKRWDDWIRDIRRGKAEVDWDELLLREFQDQVEDALIGKLSKATTHDAAVGTDPGRQAELRSYVSMSRHFLKQLDLQL